MGKIYLGKNVHEAFKERMKMIFEKFDHLLIAFSGGKDSGVMLELTHRCYQEFQPNTKISVYHIDYEGNYEQTINYVDRSLGKYPEFDYYHLCMPISASSGVSMYQSSWMPWNPKEEAIWFRKLPKNSVNINNHEFDFFQTGMSDYIFQTKFGLWLHEKNNAMRTAVLVGIRAQESLNRYHAVTRNDSYYMFGNVHYSRRVAPNVFNFYPMYDWTVEDIWTANAKFGFDYNQLYDLYYKAGVALSDMRVANPFHECGIHSLKLYRAIEPNTWNRLIGRVNGANFAAMYGGTKAVAYKSVSLPEGHTWKTYVNFLLKTLPKNVREIYLKKFRSSKKYWLRTGGSLPVSVIRELESLNIDFENLGKPTGNRKYKNEYEVVRFREYPDDVKVKNFRLVPSYKRMCITILKNDTSAHYMGFGQTKDELQKQKEAMLEWENLL